MSARDGEGQKDEKDRAVVAIDRPTPKWRRVMHEPQRSVSIKKVPWRQGRDHVTGYGRPATGGPQAITSKTPCATKRGIVPFHGLQRATSAKAAAEDSCGLPWIAD